MAHKRLLRAGESIKRELGFILDRKLADPRIGMVTVTRVELSEDLRYAKVFVSFFGDAEERMASLLLLRKARKFVRGELAHTLRMRVAPELTFLMDDSSENYLRIAGVLKEIERENGRRIGETEPDEAGDGAPRGSVGDAEDEAGGAEEADDAEEADNSDGAA